MPSSILIYTYISFITDNDDTAKALAANDILVWYFPSLETPDYRKDRTITDSPIELTQQATRCDMENNKVIDRELFLKNYNAMMSRRTTPALVLQGHPPYWTDASFDQFKEIVTYLQSRGHEFLTPTEYWNRVNNDHNDSTTDSSTTD